MKKLFGILMAVTMVLMMSVPVMAGGYGGYSSSWSSGHGCQIDLSGATVIVGPEVKLSIGCEGLDFSAGADYLGAAGGLTAGSYDYYGSSYSDGSKTFSGSNGCGLTGGISMSRASFVQTPRFTRVTATNVTGSVTMSRSSSYSSSTSRRGCGGPR